MESEPATVLPKTTTFDPQISFRDLFVLAVVGSLIPLLALTGLLVFRRQRAYLLEDAQRRLMSFVQAGVEQYSGGSELSVLATDLGEDMRVLGADLFIENAQGEIVPPVLGTQPWLGTWEHQAARDTRQSRVQVIGRGDTERIVYLAAVVDPTGAVLGSVEASLPAPAITAPLDGLRREITLIIVLASGLAVILAGWLSNMILRPIRSQLAAVASVLEGDLEARAPLSRIAEMRRLASAHNQMLDWMSEDVRDQVRRAESIQRASIPDSPRPDP